MTEKSFIKWLRRFIKKTGIKHIQMQNRFDPTYNHTTALKEISDKLENIKDITISIEKIFALIKYMFGIDESDLKSRKNDKKRNNSCRWFG